MTDDTNKKIKLFCLIAAALFGTLIQIQMSIMAERGGYLGLRINLADALLPFAGLVVCTTLFLKKSILPRWTLRSTWLWLIALSLLIVASLLHGHTVTGEWSRWALANKFIGWFVIVGYFCLGGWLATNGGAAVRDIFLRYFILTFCIIASGALIALYLNDFGVLPYPRFHIYPLSGLMGNRNAFAFLTVAVFIAAALKDFTGQGLLPRFLLPFVSLLLPILFIETGSRMGWIVTVIAFSTIALMHPKKTITRMMPYIATGIAILSVIHGLSGKPLLREHQMERTSVFVQAAKNESLTPETIEAQIPKRTSEAVRARVLQDSLTLWLSDPLFGAGLGSFLTTSHQKYAGTGAIVDLIDSTPLWLLTETGIVGFSLFFAFYGAVVHTLWRQRKDSQAAFAMLFILLVFGIMALAHEVLLTRFIWFMMGLTLTKLHSASQNEKTPPTLAH